MSYFASHININNNTHVVYTETLFRVVLSKDIIYHCFEFQYIYHQHPTQYAKCFRPVLTLFINVFSNNNKDFEDLQNFVFVFEFYKSNFF